MKKSMDLFGQVLLDYYHGNHKDKFYFLIKGKKSPFDISYYFEGLDKMSALKKRMLELVKGSVLDVGCGAGRHLLEMQKNHDVLGIDISDINIEIAQKRGAKNCIAGNFFEFDFRQKFDTITFFENGLGMAEKEEKVKDLLNKAISLLNEDGQILTIGRFPFEKPEDESAPEYIVNNITPIYQDKEGIPFSWINLNPKYLEKVCDKLSLKYELLGEEYSDDHGLYYLVRISSKK